MKNKRKLAEWMTLLVSAAILIGLIIYLVLDVTYPASPYVELEVNALRDQVQKAGSRFVLPIEIHNKGERTIAYASLRVDVAIGNEAEKENVEVEFLGRKSKTRIYKYFDSDPRSLKIGVTPVYYKFE